MAVEHTPVEYGGNVAGVDMELAGALVARAGVRQGRVLVQAGSTLSDAIEAWGDEDGDHIRFALLADDRLRSDVTAVRVTEGGSERLSSSRQVVDGDTIRFELRE